MNIAFTICSNNYLAQAKTVGDSFLEFHPDWTFVIGLCDEFDSSFDYNVFNKCEIIKVKDIGVPDFKNLVNKYNIIELNTAIKPSFIKHIFTTYEAEKLIYIDPDILVTSRFDEVITILDTKNIVITPHICSPIEDEHAPTDYHTLRGGVFNLGFIALARYNQIADFIAWWHDRVAKYGYCNFSKSMFYDQLWINYVPAMRDDYHILKHPGYNMANWNLHERNITQNKNQQFIVNNTHELRFFHFSGYSYNNPDCIASYLTRFDFNTRPDLRMLFKNYQNKLLANNIETICKLKVFYIELKNQVMLAPQKKSLLSKMRSRLKKTFTVLLTGKL